MSILDTLLPQSPPEPANARTVRFEGGTLGTRQHESSEVVTAKNRLTSAVWRERQRRERGSNWRRK